MTDVTKPLLANYGIRKERHKQPAKKATAPKNPQGPSGVAGAGLEPATFGL